MRGAGGAEEGGEGGQAGEEEGVVGLQGEGWRH